MLNIRSDPNRHTRNKQLLYKKKRSMSTPPAIRGSFIQTRHDKTQHAKKQFWNLLIRVKEIKLLHRL